MFEETNQTEEIVMPENLFEDEVLGEEELLNIQETTPEDFKSEEVLEEEVLTPEADPSEGEQTIKIKYNGEEKEIPLSEAVVLSQKGMNYDHVKGERDKITSVIDAYANAAGMNRETYLNFLDEKLLELQKENDVNRLKGQFPDADAGILQALYEKDSELSKYKALERQKENEDQAREPWVKFFGNHPEIKPEELSEEIYKLVEGKMTPEEAYLTLKVRDLENKDLAKQKNEENQKRAVGSVAGGGGKAPVDPFLEGFFGG